GPCFPARPLGKGPAQIGVACGSRRGLDGARASARQGDAPRLQEMVLGLTIDAVIFRRAARDDLTAIVALLADDRIGRERETPGPQSESCYRDAFAAIERDPNQLLAVAARRDRVIGVLQISFVPGLTRQG